MVYVGVIPVEPWIPGLRYHKTTDVSPYLLHHSYFPSNPEIPHLAVVQESSGVGTRPRYKTKSKYGVRGEVGVVEGVINC